MSEFEFDKEEFKKNVVMLLRADIVRPLMKQINSRYFRQLLIRSRII